jgi:RNA polymerase sigma factor (sigma-70 family)
MESIYIETPGGFRMRDDTEHIFDILDPSSLLITSEESEELGVALRKLRRRDRNILRRRYGLDTDRESLASIAKTFKVTKPCISKREKAALAKARSEIEEGRKRKRHE